MMVSTEKTNTAMTTTPRPIKKMIHIAHLLWWERRLLPGRRRVRACEKMGGADALY